GARELGPQVGVEPRVALLALLGVLVDARAVPVDLLEPARELLARAGLAPRRLARRAEVLRHQVGERPRRGHFDVPERPAHRRGVAALEVLRDEHLVGAQFVAEERGARFARPESHPKPLDARDGALERRDAGRAPAARELELAEEHLGLALDPWVARPPGAALRRPREPQCAPRVAGRV